MKKTFWMTSLMMVLILSCTNPLINNISEYTKTLIDIYGGTVNVKQYMDPDKNSTIITFSKCEYVDYEFVVPLAAANNAAVQLYTQYGDAVGKLTMDVIKKDSNKYSYEYEKAEIQKMIDDYPRITQHVEQEIDALINREIDDLYKIYLKSRPDNSKEVFLEQFSKILESFTKSYSKTQIIGIRRGVYKNDSIYVINSSIFDQDGKFANVYETMIKQVQVQIQDE